MAKRKRALRVTHSRELIRAATDQAVEMLDSGESAGSATYQLAQLLGDREVAEAIVSFVQTKSRPSTRMGNSEKLGGVYIGAFALLCVFAFAHVARLLYGWVYSAGSDPIPPTAAAIGQLLLLKLSWSLLKASGIWLDDSLNFASYPTTLHIPTATTSAEDRVRYERIKRIIAEMVLRRARRQTFAALHSELTRIEFTPSASVWILVQAQIGLWIRANLPPYTDRSRAYILAVTAGVAGLTGIWLLHSKVTSPAQLTYLTTWTVLFSVEFLKIPGRLTLPKAA
jgi:hypothetical protein